MWCVRVRVVMRKRKLPSAGVLEEDCLARASADGWTGEILGTCRAQWTQRLGGLLQIEPSQM